MIRVENVEGGVRHLRMLLDRYQGDLELSLAAYNAGSGAVEKHRGIPPFAETKEYVRRVLRFYDSYRGEGLQRRQISSPITFMSHFIARVARGLHDSEPAELVQDTHHSRSWSIY